MNGDIGQIVLDEETIANRLEELASEMKNDLDEDAVVVGVLRGASVFVADLMRFLPEKIRLDYLQVVRGENTVSDEGVDLIKDISTNIEGRKVFLLEDTVDTGDTLLYLKDYLLDKGAADVKLCVLLDKTERHEKECPADYVGFRVEGLEGKWNYVVGYGIDFNEHYRNLPYIGVLKEELWAPVEA